MSICSLQRNYISDVTVLIYTVTITAKESKLRSNMKKLREMIQKNKVNISTVSQDCLSSCLWFAILDQDTLSIQELLKHNPDTNLIRSGINMLWMSIIYRNVEIAKMLIEGGADVNVRISESGGLSFLHFLVATGDNQDSLELAKMMIKKGADVNACEDRFSVLQTAVVHGAVPFVEELLHNGARFKGIDLILLAARSSKSSELLPMLVNSIRDVDDKLTWIFGALQCLIEKEVTNLDEMKALLKLDTPVLDMNIGGWTILRIAVHFGKIEVVRLLLDYSADVNQKSDKKTLSPLLWLEPNVTLNDSHKLIIKHLATLSSDKADVNKSDLEKICNCPKMSAYYEKCLRDLQKD